MRAISRSALVSLVLLTLVPRAVPVSASAGAPWLPGPGAVGDDTHAGIDDMQVYLGLQDQGGTLMVRGTLGIPRNDVAAAMGNTYWLNSGFSASFSEAGLATGANLLTVYVHTPDKGWWYRQLQLNVPAAPDRAFADDPLLIVRSADPSLDVPQTTPNLIIIGYAIDRNMPLNLQLGAGGSGVGDRFLNSGWQLTLHPTDMTVDRHELYIYAEPAYWPNETLVIVPFNVH